MAIKLEIFLKHPVLGVIDTETVTHESRKKQVFLKWDRKYRYLKNDLYYVTLKTGANGNLIKPKPVKHIPTGETFKSITAASNAFNVTYFTMYEYCKKETEFQFLN